MGQEAEDILNLRLKELTPFHRFFYRFLLPAGDKRSILNQIDQEKRVLKEGEIAQKDLYTISAEEFARMQGREIGDYEPLVSLYATSEVWRVQEFAVCDVAVRLHKKMEEKGLEAIVGVSYDTSKMGWGIPLNPTRFQTTAYGSGMKLREKE